MRAQYRLLCFVLCLAVMAAIGTPTAARGIPTPEVRSTDASALLQFTSRGYVLGFAREAVYVANGSHAYRVEFVDATPTAPVADSAPSQGGPAAPLLRVSYPGLWAGVTLTYDVPDGAILRSTYRVEPLADPSAVRLRYNAPTRIEDDGTLALAYAAGTMHESAPVAWQDIEGKRVPVTAAFQIGGAGEVGFALGAYDPAYSLLIGMTLAWNTFLGGSGLVSGQSIAIDGSGNVYLAGTSDAVWGAPVRAYSGNSDAFVAKFDSAGALLWHTFLGGGDDDSGHGIAVDGSGNVLVAGCSCATWGSPMRPYSASFDAFAARLDGSGALIWNTFLGGGGADYGMGIAALGGEVLVVGYGNATWGSPVRAYTGSMDAFAARLDGSGALIWNTFLGGGGTEMGTGIAAQGGDVVVVGYGDATWGTPVRAYTGLADAFAARLNGSGALVWNTFLGGTEDDEGRGVAFDGGGNVVVAGSSNATWGAPVRAYSADGDAFVAQLDGSGALTWNTFLGGSDWDRGQSVAVSGSGGVVVAGWSDATWGAPVRAFTGKRDVFAAQLDGSGALTWNTFLGGSAVDYGFGVAADGSGHVAVTGRSFETWGSPIHPYVGDGNAFAAYLDGSGALTWNTFLSGSADDMAYAIAVDRDGNVYVAGRSNAYWGSPARGYVGLDDAFVARLDGNGALVWNTFLGGVENDAAYALTMYSVTQVFVAGTSGATWGAPILPHHQNAEAFAAVLNGSSGDLIWNTFLGGNGWDYGYGIAAEGETLYVSGYSNATWGAPVRAYSGDGDAFVAQLDGSGDLIWSTFLGGSGGDLGYGIAAYSSSCGPLAVVVGSSTATWGTPIRAYTGSADAFAAQLNSEGSLGWNTFLGGGAWDDGYAVAMDDSGRVVVAGRSDATWGAPVRAYTAGSDAFTAELDIGGNLIWNTFLGGSGWDEARGIALDGSGNAVVVGSSDATWGTPLRAYTGLTDAFAAEVDGSGELTWNTFLGGQGSDQGHSVALTSNVCGVRAAVAGETDATWGTPIRAYTAGWEAFAVQLTSGTFCRVFLPLVAR